MKTKKKNRFTLPHFSTFVFVLLSIIPALLLIFGMHNLASLLKFQKVNTLDSTKTLGKSCSFESESLSEGIIPEQIEIKKLGLRLNIYSQPPVNGSWEVSNKGANYAEGTSKITTSGGNVGIFGHNTQNIFGNLKNLSEGDEILIFSGNYRMNYVVTEAFTSNPNDVDVFYETQTPLLTLVTCEGVFFEKRYIIRARLEALENVSCDE